MHKPKNIISFYPGHDSALAWSIEGQVGCIQMEKLSGKRYQGIESIKRADFVKQIDVLKDRAEQKNTTFDTLLLSSAADVSNRKWGPIYDQYNRAIVQRFPQIKTIRSPFHHTAHAAVGFYSSPFKEAIVITCDGGGDGEYFGVYHASRENGITQLDSSQINLGAMYLLSSMACKEIGLTTRNALAGSGKGMGMVAGGKLNKKASRAMKVIWKNQMWYRPGASYVRPEGEPFFKMRSGQSKQTKDWFANMMGQFGVDINDWRLVQGQSSRDLMYTTQYTFEHMFKEMSEPYLNDPQYAHLPIVLSGGCALNVLNNEVVKKQYFPREVFVPSCPGDEGLALGSLMYHLQPKEQVRIHDIGPLRYDIAKPFTTTTAHKNDQGDDEYPNICEHKVSLEMIAELLNKGKTVGVVQGRSEIGPRALGFRSILCDPSYPEMKNKINTIKHREWFRPFAPVCKLEHAEEYFDSPSFKHMEYMSFAVDVKEDAKEKIPAVTHFDGTARLQTVTEDSNKWLYDLLSVFEKYYKVNKVLLNTSFNIQGQAILNSASDAMKVLRDNKGLDCIVVDSLRESEGLTLISYQKVQQLFERFKH